jgi:phosphatidylglycerophosphate synthase
MKINVNKIPLYSKDLPPRERIMGNFVRKNITPLFLHTPLSGNQVTLLSAFFALIGAIFMTLGNYWYSLLGILLFTLFIVLDYVDGQVARYRKEQSPAGEYLDSRFHHIVEPIFFICAGIGAFNISGSIIYLSSGIAASTFYLMRQLMKVPGKVNIRRAYKEKSKSGKLNYYLFEFLRINQPGSLLFFAIILNITGPVLVIYAVIFLLNLILSFYKTYSGLKAENEK